MNIRSKLRRLFMWGRRALFLLRLRLGAWLRKARIEVNIASDANLGQSIRLEIKPNSRTKLTIGRRCKLGDGARLRLHGGEIRVGDDVDIRGLAVLNVSGGLLQIDGCNVLSWGVIIHCANSVHLSRFAYAGEYSTIVDSNHYYSSPDTWSYYNSRSKPIFLGKDVWVCPKSTITSGVVIGDHTIVAPNSCVTKDAPAGVLVSGVPAKVVRTLDLPWQLGDKEAN